MTGSLSRFRETLQQGPVRTFGAALLRPFSPVLLYALLEASPKFGSQFSAAGKISPDGKSLAGRELVKMFQEVSGLHTQWLR